MVIFINGHRMEVPDGATASQAIEAFDPGLQAEVSAGRAYLSDGTGQAIDPDLSLEPGAILRAAQKASRKA